MRKQAIRDIGSELDLHIAAQTISFQVALDKRQNHRRTGDTFLALKRGGPLEPDTGMTPPAAVFALDFEIIPQ